ncbi:SGNH hydrolase-type esterase domain-containing protein [Massariosphaeria phaeospora]|uniref:SGNH hydrolase-type esterase domain-containing protein n=1 Tax=Massariosphaeria phaeospora TaxID=100035 RepID=A0A7C8IBB3_9PLEO|nr:SGNH hydrolase-type esterase domain-containing protein [Massariosphaeria phaeospora]
MPASYDQFFLFGDSITQDSFRQQRGFGFSAALQDAYIRRLDVVNRGLSGYNSRQGLKVLPKIFPSPDQARVRFLVVFFGANDAALPAAVNNQHIPLPEYKQNLEKIITHPLVVAHKPRIILVAAPPINEHLQWLSDQARGARELSRVAARTKSYADAAVGVGQKLNVPVVNLWKAFMSKTNFNADVWKTGDALPGSKDLAQDEALVKMMYDGLHFAPAGYEVMFEELMNVITQKWPDQVPEKLPMVLPAWNDATAWESFE